MCVCVCVCKQGTRSVDGFYTVDNKKSSRDNLPCIFFRAQPVVLGPGTWTKIKVKFEKTRITIVKEAIEICELHCPFRAFV